MNKIMSTILIILLSFVNIYGQSQVRYEKPPNIEQIGKMKKKIESSYKRLGCSMAGENLKFLIVYSMTLKDRPVPKLFMDDNFLKQLHFFSSGQDRFTHSKIIIYDDYGHAVGYGFSDYKVYCFYSKSGALRSEFEYLLEYKSQHASAEFFQINSATDGLYFTKENGVVSVLIIEPSKLEIMNLSDFVSSEWNKYFPNEILQIYYPD